jgi:phospholipase/carboxylesterase
MTLTLNGLPSLLLDAAAPAHAPLIVAMHGIGSNEADLVPAYRAFERQAVLAFPRSPLPHPPGHAWYRLIRIGVPDPASFAQAQQTLGGWLRALRAVPGLEARPLILSGFSQGAIMALSYALGHPDEVAGVIAFSGYIPQPVLEAVPPAQPGSAAPAILLTHGRRDPLFPFSRLDETAGQLAARGFRPKLAPHDGAHDIPPAALAAAGEWLSTTFPPQAPPAR